MKENKLSREELIKIIQEVDRDCAGEGLLKDGYKRMGLKQIKSLLTPIPEEKLEWLMIWRSSCLNAHNEHEAIGDCENCKSYTECKKAYDELRRG